MVGHFRKYLADKLNSEVHEFIENHMIMVFDHGDNNTLRVYTASFEFKFEFGKKYYHHVPVWYGNYRFMIEPKKFNRIISQISEHHIQKKLADNV